ncbi:sensor domain-containing diguanylate cyclase [Sphaerotilus microaerophilus]|uniref:GGDEF domain-containing protein n=1 Tax=Sphaerotilus microaerophilus TaxID=2914710 RepID=A0ABN6PSA6_9BURK|nr:sensor domain-containing diguanylate cyclase [Sphaerotilus sp. FB-5]BDI07523.1 hypothetical protein CATMQ487_44930 [Sphaerotilus sp. FB-5]
MPLPTEASTTLARQLRQLHLQPDQTPPDPQQWLALLDTVGRTYEDFERQIAQATQGDPAWADTIREAREVTPRDPLDAAAWSWRLGDEALQVSAGLAHLLHLPPGTRELPLTVWLACLDDSDRELQCEYLMQAAQQRRRIVGQLRYMPATGNEQRWLHYELQSDPVGDDDAVVRCQVRDITARVRAEQSQPGSDDQDALTGLHSRARLLNLAATARARAEHDGSRVGLLHLNVDGFHRLNELHGREVGDRLLCGVAQRLRSSVRLGDQIGRLAGDEFLLLVHPVESVQHLEAIAYKLQAAVAVPMDIGHESVGLSLSVGVAMYPQDAASTLDLVRAAGRALQAARQRGRGRCVIHELLPTPPRTLKRPGTDGTDATSAIGGTASA